MELFGAKINFLGDSITEGCGTSGGAAVFPERIKAAYGLAEARNYGIGGTRFARQRWPSEDPVTDMDFCGRVKDMDQDADAVVVFGGTNDYGHGDAPLGTPEDRTAETFFGACHELFTRLRERFPDAKLLAVTPMRRLDGEKPSWDARKTAESRYPLESYVNAIRETADEMGIPVLDLYGIGLMDPADPELREAFVPDGLHPNDAGHALLADEIGRCLESL